MNENEKNSKKGLIAIIISCITALILIIVLCFTLFSTAFLSPKQKVILAFSKAFGADSIFSLISGNEKCKTTGNLIPYNGITAKDIKNIQNLMNENGQQINIDARLKKFKSQNNSAGQLANGAGFSMNILSDKAERKAYSDILLKYGAISVIDASLYVDDADISLELPDYYDGYLTINTESLGKDLKKSIFASEVNEELYSLSFNIYDYYEEVQNNQLDYQAISLTGEKSIELLKDLYEDVNVEETGAVDSFAVGEKEIKCKEYKISIDKKLVKDFIKNYNDIILEGYLDYMDAQLDAFANNFEFEINGEDIDDLKDELHDNLEEQFDEMSDSLLENFAKDYEFYVYLDNKCRLINIYYNDTYTDEYDDEYLVEVDLGWHGEDNLIDDFTGSIYLESENSSGTVFLRNEGASENGNRHDLFTIEIVAKDDDEDNITITLDASRNKDREFDYKLKFDHNSDDQYVLFSASGSDKLTEDSFTIDFDELKCEYDVEDDKATISFDLSICMSAINEEIPSPKKPEYKVFKMTESDFEELGEEISDNIDKNPLFKSFL